METLEGWESCPEDARGYLQLMGSAAVGLLDISSVGPLTPVCQAFKSLINAFIGVAKVRGSLLELVFWCASLTRIFIEEGSGALSAGIQSKLKDFASTTTRLALRAEVIAKRHKAKALVLYLKDAAEIASFEATLRKIFDDVGNLASLINVTKTRELGNKMDRLAPPILEAEAAIPPGALDLPDIYVERTAKKEEVVRALTSSDAAASDKIHLLFGMGGGGKTVLASSVVREVAVRKHFRQGIYWVTVGRSGKKQLHVLLQGLARDVGATSTDASHGVPHQFSTTDEIVQHMTLATKSSTLPRLVVLDDVWHREVVDALLPTGLVILVTTRERSVARRVGYTEIGDMDNTEALTLLRSASGLTGAPGGEVPAGMQQVILVLILTGKIAIRGGKVCSENRVNVVWSPVRGCREELLVVESPKNAHAGCCCALGSKRQGWVVHHESFPNQRGNKKQEENYLS